MIVLCTPPWSLRPRIYCLCCLSLFSPDLGLCHDFLLRLLRPGGLLHRSGGLLLRPSPVCSALVGFYPVCSTLVGSCSVCSTLVGSSTIRSALVGSCSICSALVGSCSVCSTLVSPCSVSPVLYTQVFSTFITHDKLNPEHSLIQRLYWSVMMNPGQRHSVLFIPEEMKVNNVTVYVYIYIYIYAFSRCFYPKRLTVHSGYKLFFVNMCVPWDNNSPFGLHMSQIIRLVTNKGIQTFGMP